MKTFFINLTKVSEHPQFITTKYSDSLLMHGVNFSKAIIVFGIVTFSYPAFDS